MFPKTAQVQYTVESQFFEPPMETRIGSKSQIVHQEIRGKAKMFNGGKGMTLLVRVIRKFEINEGSRIQNSTVD